jgi:hypothetical protein
MSKWIRKRKNAGMNTLNSMADLEVAKELFKAWDLQQKRYIKIDFLTEKLVALGLSEDLGFVSKLMESIKGKTEGQGGAADLMTLPDFLGIFSTNKLGTKAC